MMSLARTCGGPRLVAEAGCAGVDARGGRQAQEAARECVGGKEAEQVLQQRFRPKRAQADAIGQVGSLQQQPPRARACSDAMRAPAGVSEGLGTPDPDPDLAHYTQDMGEQVKLRTSCGRHWREVRQTIDRTVSPPAAKERPAEEERLQARCGRQPGNPSRLQGIR